VFDSVMGYYSPNPDKPEKKRSLAKAQQERRSSQRKTIKIVNSQFHTTPACGRQELAGIAHLQSSHRYPKMLI